MGRAWLARTTARLVAQSPAEATSVLIDSMDFMKLDDGLAALIRTHDLPNEELVSVIITTETSTIDVLIELIGRAHGRVRHVLRPLDAVAAWIPFGEIQSLMHRPMVREIELDGVNYIA